MAIAVVLAGVLVLAWVGARSASQERRLARAFATESGALPLSDITASVEVLRDARGIPHIEALRERDAWVALGFVHAQDRLAQMLWLRRLARGRTAEVVGEPGLVPDRMARTLGIGRLADAAYQALAPEVVRVLEAYAEGVNARLDRIRLGQVQPPLELVGRAERFDEWQPADALALIKLIAFSSSNLLETGIVLDDLIQWLGGQPAQPFLPSSTSGRGVEIPSSGPADILDPEPILPQGELLTPSRALTESVAIRGGSAWVLGGRHTASGAPILVADLRLPPTVPSLIYEIHLRGGDVDVAGATIPGIPLVWAGRNLHVAWAATPTDAVTVDLYHEKVRADEGLYQNGRVWVPLITRTEVIRVLGAGGSMREEEIVVRSTRHGPLINDLLLPPGRVVKAAAPTPVQVPILEPAEATAPVGESAPAYPDSGDDLAGIDDLPLTARADRADAQVREPLALRWTGMIAGDGFASLLGVLGAANADELLEALSVHHEPVVAVTFADDQGNAGMQLAGWLPERRLPSDVVPVPGRMRLYDWKRQIEFSALPASRLSPGRTNSWVIAADGDLGDGLTGAGIEWLWRTGEQSRRLHARLKEMTSKSGEKVGLRDAAALQAEGAGGPTSDVIPALLRLSQRGGALRPEAREVAQMLGRWNGDMGPDSQGAAVYHVLMEHLVQALFQERFGDDLYHRYMALPRVRPAVVAESLVLSADRSARAGGWADVERVSGAVRNSLRRAWVSMVYRLGPSREDWTWGRLHLLTFRPFADLGQGAHASASSLPGLAIGGDETLLGGVAYDPELGSYPVSEAATYRLAVDLAAPDKMLSSLAPGQSEHLGHRHYGDGLTRWAEGRPSLLLTSRLLVEEETGARLLLEPQP